jgi:hypothetical protein
MNDEAIFKLFILHHSRDSKMMSHLDEARPGEGSLEVDWLSFSAQRVRNSAHTRLQTLKNFHQILEV